MNKTAHIIHMPSPAVVLNNKLLSSHDAHGYDSVVSICSMVFTGLKVLNEMLQKRNQGRYIACIMAMIHVHLPP